MDGSFVLFIVQNGLITFKFKGKHVALYQN